MECDFCQLERDPLHGLDLPGQREWQVCGPCRDRFTSAGRGAPEPFQPELERTPLWEWRLPLAPDARWLLARLGATPVAATDLPRLRAALGLEGAGTPPPSADAIAQALTAAVLAGEELGPWERVERLGGRLEGLGELLLGVYAHAAARVRLNRLLESEESVRRAAQERDPQALDKERDPAAGSDLLLRAPALAAAAAKLDPTLPRLLEAARQAYQYSGASLPPARRGAQDGLGHRAALLLAGLLVERGDGALAGGAGKERGEGSLERAEALLREVLQAIEQRALPVDPRAQLLQAALQRLKGWKDGCDRALAAGLSQAAQAGDAHAEARAALLRDRTLRAGESGQWAAATESLRALRALRPHEPGALLELAHLYYRRSLPSVAREVLEASLRRAPDAGELEREASSWLSAAQEEIDRHRSREAPDPDAALLLASCLLRLGQLNEAARALEPYLDEEVPGRAQHWHLAGLIAQARGEDELALAHLARAVERTPAIGQRGARRRALARVAVAALRERLIELAERTRALREELAGVREDARTGRAERAEAEAEAERLAAQLTEALQGDPGAAEPWSAPTLPGFFQAVARLGPLLSEELDQVGGNLGEGIVLAGTDLLGIWLLCALSNAEQRVSLSRLPVFQPLLDAGFGFSRLDRARGSDSLSHAFLALRSLLADRLPEAVRHDAALETRGLPLELLLRLVHLATASEQVRQELAAVTMVNVWQRLAARGLVRLEQS